MRLRSTFVAVFAAVPLVLAGCSQSGPAPQDGPAPQAKPPEPQQAPPQPGPSGPPVKPESVAWTGQLCGFVGGFAASQQQAPQVDKTTPETFKASSVAQMTAAEKSADDTLGGLQKMGPSPIAGADKVNETFQGGFSQVKDVLGTAKGQAEQVDTSNQQSLTAGMTGVQQQLQKGQGINFEAQFAEFDKNGELRDAAGHAPECQALMAPPQQAPQPQQPQ